MLYKQSLKLKGLTMKRYLVFLLFLFANQMYGSSYKDSVPLRHDMIVQGLIKIKVGLDTHKTLEDVYQLMLQANEVIAKAPLWEASDCEATYKLLGKDLYKEKIVLELKVTCLLAEEVPYSEVIETTNFFARTLTEELGLDFYIPVEPGHIPYVIGTNDASNGAAVVIQ